MNDIMQFALSVIGAAINLILLVEDSVDWERRWLFAMLAVLLILRAVSYGAKLKEKGR